MSESSNRWTDIENYLCSYIEGSRPKRNFHVSYLNIFRMILDMSKITETFVIFNEKGKHKASYVRCN